MLVHGAAGGLAAAFPAVARSLGASRITGTVSSQARSAGMLGFAVGPYLQDNPSAARPTAERAVDLLASGRLAQRVDELPLAEAAEAHRRLEAREVPGRIVLTI